MKNLRSEIIARSNEKPRTFLTLHKVIYESREGQERPYYMVTRGDEIVPLSQKTPDAVVVIAFVKTKESIQILLTKEFRVPVGGNEIGFPAGLIDQADHVGSMGIRETACKAAIREFHEETGMTFHPKIVSSPNLYSSAGLTNESAIFVVGEATGKPSKEFLEPSEDIETLLMTQKQVAELLQDDSLNISKAAWPLMWLFSHFGDKFWDVIDV